MKNILIADLQNLARATRDRSLTSKHPNRLFKVEITSEGIHIRVTDRCLRSSSLDYNRLLGWERAGADLSVGFIKYMLDQMETRIDCAIADANSIPIKGHAGP